MRISDWSSDVCSSDLQELQDNVFHILTDIARFRQRRCIRHGERHIKGLGERLRQQSLAAPGRTHQQDVRLRSEEHTSELQSLMRISYAVFCLKKKNIHITHSQTRYQLPTL